MNNNEVPNNLENPTSLHISFFIGFFALIIVGYLLSITKIIYLYGLIINALFNPVFWVLAIPIGLLAKKAVQIIPCAIFLALVISVIQKGLTSEVVNIMYMNSVFSTFFQLYLAAQCMAILFISLLVNGIHIELKNRKLLRYDFKNADIDTPSTLKYLVIFCAFVFAVIVLLFLIL